MCGITGFLDITTGMNAADMKAAVTRMADAIRHRGPDDSGVWVDEQAGIALGFRRLSILDLSPSGHQPMLSADERFVMIYNGEVYNFAEIRAELLPLGYRLRGTSDSEIMLAVIQQWGIHEAVKRFNGMFAFALFDRQERTLYIVRDRLGIKPLYYGWAGNTFLFGSELKALRAHPDFKADINRDALALYLRYSYIPEPHSIYQRFFKLPAGCILAIKPDQRPGDEHPEVYWSAREAVERGLANPFEGNDREAIDELDRMLTHSIGQRMIADVPLGAFLSGGVDSSTIVALMQKQSNIPVKTFTIGFEEAGFNEAEHAKAVAKYLGTQHTELYVTSQEAQAVIPRLSSLYDEPFADSSQIPTFLVSKLARQHVTVSLSGDGGDELYGGYNRYFWTMRLWNTIGWLPSSLRNLSARALTTLSPQAWGYMLGKAGFPNPRDKIHKLAEILGASHPAGIYVDLVSHWKQPDEIVINGHEPSTLVMDPTQWLLSPHLSEQMMALDLVTYLPDDILAKVDRASMGVSLEARAPFLDDHETVEFAWRLPLHMKIRNRDGKWILKQVLDKYLPREMMERPKMGFGVPIDSWLRGPLRDWAESLLAESRLRSEGFFNPAPIRQKWAEHLSGARNWQYYLWDILMFQSWLEENEKTGKRV